MTREESIKLFDDMHPNFFEKDYIKAIPEKIVCDEMILVLKDFDETRYTKETDGVVFGEYHGDTQTLLEAVRKVSMDWVQYFEKGGRIYCGTINGEIACFCFVSDMGRHMVGSKELHIGGPGCVGTVPAYRNRGIGLTMVKNVTRILKDEGFDMSYIHYTGVAAWYEKLGYRTILKWNCKGII